MTKNQKLKEYLQSLSQIAYSLYEKALHGSEFQDDSSLLGIKLRMLDQKVTEIPEFSACLRLMAEDKNIEALQGKMVGSYHSRGRVNGETCLLVFLIQLYLKSPKYDQILFDQKYLAFENYFYSDYLEFKDSAKLYNFEFSKNELALGYEIFIKRDINPIDSQDGYKDAINHPKDFFSKSNYSLQRDYSTKKIVDEQSIQNDLELGIELSKTGELFDLIINSLRILKSSAVYRDHRIKTEDKTFNPVGGTITRMPSFENVAIGEKCQLEITDIPTICRIFEFLLNEKDSRFTVAQRRLSLGIERKNTEDRLIDYMIGLEALYLPDGNDELSFRLSFRVAFLLFLSKTERKDTFNFVKRMYKTRSNIVHGSNYNLDEKDVKKLEELLRKSINLWIEDKNNFSVNKFTDSGKLKTEGKLDNILFDA